MIEWGVFFLFHGKKKNNDNQSIWTIEDNKKLKRWKSISLILEKNANKESLIFL